jgi:hypothetical protein
MNDNPMTTTDRRQKISEGVKRKWQDPDYRAKMQAYYEQRRADPDKAWSRRGVPNGYTREQAELMWAESRASAERTIGALEDRGALQHTGSLEDHHAREALVYAMTIMRSGFNERLRLAAARLLLEFLVPRPARKGQMALATAEEWLDLLSGERAQA